MAEAWKNLPPFNGIYSKDPNKKEAACQNSGWEAPQRDNDGSPSVTSAAAAFCRQMDGKSVTKQPLGVNREFRHYPYRFYSYYLWAGSRYGAPTENKCGDTNTISKDKCESTIIDAMITCDPNSGISHGASANGSCITYVS